MKPIRFAHLLWVAAVLAGMAGPPPGFAQAYPSRPIRVVVPYEPGGAIDITARAAAPGMSEDLGQPVVVENRGGADGHIGAQQVARAAPDGYTIMFTIGGGHILSMFSYKDLPYHPVRDFTPITAAADSVLCIAAAPSFPPGSLTELVDYARRYPGKVSYGTTGIGGLTHLAMEQIRMLTGTDMEHGPYKGGSPLTVNLLSGQLALGVLPLAPLMQQARSGKVKVLAVFLPKRFRLMPDIPTVVESLPAFRLLEGSGVWVYGPAGMAKPVVQRLNGAIVKTLNRAEVRDKLESLGELVVGNAPEAFAAQIAAAVDFDASLVKAAGVQPQ